MKLGQKVRFRKYLRKNNYCNWYSGSLDEDKDYQKYSTIELNEDIEGIICGKRVIGFRGYTYIDYEYGTEYTSLEKKTVILVANQMMGFYRVPEEWLEEMDI